MKFIKTEIPEVLIIEPTIIADNRGYFFESFSMKTFQEQVCNTHFIQENESLSHYGVIRGLHFQKPPYAQAKLVRVISGKIWDIIVDIRKGSPTFGKHMGVELSSENKKQLFIPRGFAHGFATLSPQAIVQYKCDNYYNPASEGSISYDDAFLSIDWKLPAESIIISSKDANHPAFNDAFHFNYNEI